jgi:hypothetical protein
MTEVQCNRCGLDTPEPGSSIPLLSIPLLSVFGKVAAPWRRGGYCIACARFASSLTVYVCLAAVVVAIGLRFFLLR